MLTIEKVLFLRKIDFFSSMTSKELGHIAAISEEVVYSAGSEVIREGEYGDSMFLVVDGEVRIHRGGTELLISKKNDFFGEMTLIDGEPRSASATAVTDSLLLCINQADFHEILSGNFQAVLAIMRTLSHRLRKSDD